MVDRGAFEEAVAFVLRLEGGYSDSPIDPGGETKFGISKRRYPHLNIRELTQEQAEGIYRRDFWDRNRCSEIAYAPLACHYLSACVNVGPTVAAKALQRAANSNGACVTVDGIAGSRTIAAVNAVADAGLLLNAFFAHLLEHYLGLGYDAYLKGWARRVVAFPKELVA
ncbi:MAG: hypothetical protein OEY97_13555 [Nitrospirota bacterium]|nr:hypothetical protein [Nitrospirota bacterium]